MVFFRLFDIWNELFNLSHIWFKQFIAELETFYKMWQINTAKIAMYLNSLGIVISISSIRCVCMRVRADMNFQKHEKKCFGFLPTLLQL